MEYLFFHIRLLNQKASGTMGPKKLQWPGTTYTIKPESIIFDV